MPYGERDAARGHRYALIAQRLKRRFHLARAPAPHDCRDGDVLLVTNHLAVVVHGIGVEMAGRRLRLTKLGRMWPHVTGVFRHRALCDPGDRMDGERAG